MRTKDANESAERENANETVRAEWEGLSDADLEKMTGGGLQLYEFCCKGTSIPKIAIEAWRSKGDL